MTRDDELEVLHEVLEAARRRVSNGDEKAQPIVTAVEQLIAERDSELSSG